MHFYQKIIYHFFPKTYSCSKQKSPGSVQSFNLVEEAYGVATSYILGICWGLGVDNAIFELDIKIIVYHLCMFGFT